MQLYHIDATFSQNTARINLATVFGWVIQKLDQYRIQKANKKHIAYLRTLDRHILADMGVDIAALGTARPTLASFIPQFNPSSTTTFGIKLPVNMSSR